MYCFKKYAIKSIFFCAIAIMLAACDEGRQQAAPVTLQTSAPVVMPVSAPASAPIVMTVFAPASSHSEVFDIPADWMNKWKDGLNNEEFQLAKKLAIKGMEQDSKLANKTRELIKNPEAFSTDQIDESLDELLKLTVNMVLLDWIKGAAAKYQPITLNPTIKTWELLDEHIVSPGSLLDAAITRLARRAALKPGCDLAYMGIKGMSPVFWYEYTLAKVEAEKQTCGGLDYFVTKNGYSLSDNQQQPRWLAEKWQEQTKRVDKLRKYVGNEDYSFIHKELIDGVEGGCERNIPSLASVLGVCPWRMNTDRSEYSKQVLDADKTKYKYFPIEMKNGMSMIEIEKAINVIAQKLVAGSADNSFSALKDIGFYPVKYWVSPDQTKVVFQVVSGASTIVSDNSRPRYIPFMQERTILISVTSKGSRYTYVPGNYGQYDDGDIVAISDKDKDGNIEVWIEATWGECDGEGLRPGIDCAIVHHYMAEQFGNYLGGFVQGLRPQIKN